MPPKKTKVPTVRDDDSSEEDTGPKRRREDSGTTDAIDKLTSIVVALSNKVAISVNSVTSAVPRRELSVDSLKWLFDPQFGPEGPTLDQIVGKISEWPNAPVSDRPFMAAVANDVHEWRGSIKGNQKSCESRRIKRLAFTSIGGEDAVPPPHAPAPAGIALLPPTPPTAPAGAAELTPSPSPDNTHAPPSPALPDK
ncbi:hypothetical protein PAPYR_9328 [Paratrimastix pyriformis]|uniref:Uncharacterized protein n=1 Tax=Paratrimastix pyriformis TaxID=342808 RepID=A0ABQ8UBF8_9EUKA|nr:hypothetical protein PAPYR_9328 [Paratrimastix pyriformis]